MKIDAFTYSSHNPYEEDHRVSCLRENLTSSSEGEGLETGNLAPRQSFTRQVLFKMAKQHLKLVKEIQGRDFDMLIAHTTIVFMRYMFIAYRVRMTTDHRSFGDLFYACCQELDDIGFVEALHRIMTLAVEQLRQMGTFCEKTATSFFDTVMSAALKYVNLSTSRLITNNC